MSGIGKTEEMSGEVVVTDVATLADIPGAEAKTYRAEGKLVETMQTNVVYDRMQLESEICEIDIEIERWQKKRDGLQSKLDLLNK